MKIGDQLKAARLLKKISKFDLAQKSNISLNLLSEIEQNTFFPDYKTFDKICNALEVSTNQIIYEILENEISLKSEGQKRTITEF